MALILNARIERETNILFARIERETNILNARKLSRKRDTPCDMLNVLKTLALHVQYTYSNTVLSVAMIE